MSTNTVIPAYKWAAGALDDNGSTNGCNGCAFRKMSEIKCSLIPCQLYPGMVARLINTEETT